MKHTVITMRRLVLLLAMVLLAWGGRAQALQLIPMTLEETAHHAEAIFIGRVTAGQSRWGSPAKRWIVTDYAFDIEETILSNAEVKTGRKITLPFWGGIIGNEEHRIGGLKHPVAGQRYLIMLRPDARGFGLTPAVGVTHGLLQIVALPNGVEEIREYEGQPLYRGMNGKFLRHDQLTQNSQAIAGVTRTAFTDWLRANLQRIKATPPPVRSAPDRNDPRIMPLFAKTPRRSPLPDGLELSNASMPPLTAERLGFTPPLPDKPELSSGFRAPETGGQTVPPPRTVQYTPEYFANFPIVFNQLPANFTPWSPEDQFQIANWNYYADIFRVYANPTETFSWQDGVSDICGFLDEATLNAIYGDSWAGGALAVAHSRLINNRLIESDIALNAGHTWTMDHNRVLDGTAWKSYRYALCHELGHAHGLGHEDSVLALMGSQNPEKYAAFSLPFTDDAEGVRSIYPARVVFRHDLGIFLFRQEFGGRGDMTFPASVTAGNNITVTNYHLENAGTATVGTPTLEWYLTRQRDYNAAYYGIGSTTYSSLARFQYFNPGSVSRTLNVPVGVPEGQYYLNAFIRNDGGPESGAFPFSNNYGWSRNKIVVGARLMSLSLNPSTVIAGQSSTGTATLNSAITTPRTLPITSTNPAVASPSNPSLAVGQSTGTFNVTTVESAVTRDITLTGRLYDVNASAVLTVQANINAPTSLMARADSASRILLAWQDSSSIEFGFRIERKMGSGGTWTQIATVGSNVRSYADTGLAPMTTYFYRVRAYNGSFHSAYSNEAAARTRQTLYTINGRVTDDGNGLGGTLVYAGGTSTASQYFDAVSGAAITDYSTVESSIEMTSQGSIQDVHVAVNLTHTYIGDLKVTLIAPDGTEVILHNRTGGGDDNLVTLYPDATASAESLAALVGRQSGGIWRLRVEDQAGSDAGTFNSWSLEVRYTGDYYTVSPSRPDGFYSLAVPVGTYTMTPVKGYYAFTPNNRTVNVTSDVFGVDFATGFSANNSIRGRMTTTDGTGLPGVTMRAYTTIWDEFSQGGSVGSPITDYSTQTNTMTVPNTGVLTSMSVGVNITHTYIGDLKVTLIAPDGTEVILHNRTGGGTDNISTTYPFLTAPAQSLAILNGRAMTGNWTLRVEDQAGGDVGTFNSWSLTLNYTAPSLWAETTTRSDGTYIMNGLPPDTYRVVPADQGLTFTPSAQTVTLSPSASNVNFAAAGAVAVLTGYVGLQGVVNSVQPITFEFQGQGTGTPLFNRTHTLGSLGEFTIVVPPGFYDVAVKGAKWLKQTFSFEAYEGGNSGILFPLPGGDANNDNAVDITDLLLLVAHYNQATPSAGYLEAADFNCDNVVDVSDLSLLISNYNRQGDP